jgi:hypothetical protein
MASQKTLEDKNVSHLLTSRAEHKHDHGPGRDQQANSSKDRSLSVYRWRTHKAEETTDK